MTAPVGAIAPGVVLVILVIGVNLLVDGLRDVSDPTLASAPDEPARGGVAQRDVVGRCRARAGRLVHGRTRRAPRSHRRVRFREVAHGVRHHRAAARGARGDREHRCSTAPRSSAHRRSAWCPCAAASCSFVFQEPLTALDPLMKLGRQLAEPIARHQGLRGAALEASRPRGARRGAPARTRAHRGVTLLRDLRRTAAAGRHRHGARLPSAAAHRRRAHHRPRRDRPVRGARRSSIASSPSGTWPCVFVSHDLAVVSRMTDHALVMRAGEAVERGSIGELLAAPTAPLHRGLRRQRAPASRRASPQPSPRGGTDDLRSWGSTT